MRFGLLGPLTVHDGTADRAVSGTKARTVLGALLLQSNRLVAADELKTALWGEHPPATAAGSLHNHVSRLRRALAEDGGSRLRSVAHGYILDVRDGELDSALFEDHLREARAARLRRNWENVRHECAQALELWRGNPLADVPDLADVMPYSQHIQSLHEARLHALEWRCDAELELGRHHGLAAELGSLVAEYPLREAFHRQLMLVLHRTDRQAEAVAVFHRLRRTLVDELGIEPGSAVQDAFQEIIEGRPPRSAAEPGPVSPSSPSSGTSGAPTSAPASPPAAPPDPHTAGRTGAAHPLDYAPAQLPPAAFGFSGRRTELSRLADIVGRAARQPGTATVIAVTGTGGVGKTALALHWAHRIRHQFPDGQLYVNLRGFCPSGTVVAPADAIREFLDGLGVPRARIPATVEARTGLFRSLTAGRRFLILLDNARDAEQIRPLLPGASESLVLVTSRDRLPGLVAVEGAHPVPLDLLSADEARELLATRIGSGRAAAETTAVSEIIELTAGLPLALAIVSAQAAVHPDLSMDRLAGQLRQAHGLDAFASHDVLSDLRAVLSWSYETLSAGAARLFRLMAVHPGPSLSAPAAASLSGLPLPRVRPLLAELAQVQLITESTAGRYAFHDLLRAYASELASEPAEGDGVGSGTDRLAAVQRVVDHYLHSARTAASLMDPQLEPINPPPMASPQVQPEDMADAAAAGDWFTQEHAVLLAVVRQAASAELHCAVWQLAYHIKTFLYWRGHWADLAATQAAALDATRQMGDLAAQAHAHRSLGKAVQLLEGEEGEGTSGKHLTCALDLFAELGHLVGQAETHLDLGQAYEQRDHVKEALHHNQRALDLFRAAGHKNGEAKSLNNVAYFHTLLGDHTQALDQCRKALSLLDELGDRRSLALTWDTLGLVHHEMGQYDEAAGCYLRAVEGCREVGVPYHESLSLTHLGETRLAAGDSLAARDAWRQALELLDTLKHPDAENVRLRLKAVNG
ncbi:BTAD domain-containing putative transcriptional regulator [Streptomyces sp. H10-C2]|uniref:AfsR/SARP family transcriptional regulator n=1 Tax=unclassified Streptomyces TaxID=2593676 RepID=UPI0024B9D3A5|nr:MULTISPECIES: BTAD domain-containing putative transcriptional regulator [unclassified Streptomyces]MDJ0345161.1 BTAD domain-containing putative transcriptional regulator [Streptomyces sp. PH10-H1]MDJ0374129.1 BTAD domain-containing putative transcriptional regulator [Streptomyces sp. H10-C2]